MWKISVMSRLASSLIARCLLHVAKMSTITSAVPNPLSSNETIAAKDATWKPFWDPGSGHYGDTWGQTGRMVVDALEDLVLSRVDAVSVPNPKGQFTVGDYGTCDGFASLQLMQKIISQLRRKHGEDLSIQLVYEDQETNDFNSLFKRIHGTRSALSSLDKVFPVVSGTSFYRQCVPDNTFDVIISTLATQWLSEQRCSNSVFPWISTQPEELRAYHETAARDWKNFLLLRARELKPGGFLVVVAVARLSEDSSLYSAIPDFEPRNPPPCSNYDTYLNFDASWQELYHRGVITNEEFSSCTARVMLRSLQDLKAPFEDKMNSPVRKAGLILHQQPRQYMFPCLAQNKWKQKLKTEGLDDRDYFADLVTTGVRLWSDTIFRNSLSDRRSAQEKAAIMDLLYENFRGRVTQSDPNVFRNELITNTLVAQKLFT